MNDNYIDYPSDEEIKKQIDLILSKALPQKVSFISKMCEIYRNVGIKNLFNDGIKVLLIMLIITAIGINYYLNIMLDKPVDYLYLTVFTTSPIFYMTISILLFAENKQAKTIEVIMSCKYTIYHLSAFKMLFISIVSVILNSFIILFAVLMYSEINYLNLLLLSISSLFLFALGFLYILIQTGRIYSSYIFSGSWILINILISIINRRVYSWVLSIIPIPLHLLINVFLIIGFFKNLKKLVFSPMELS